MAKSLTAQGAAERGTPAASGGRTFFGHPRGLATLFMTEMWERFSFYGMRALLPLYLIAGGPAADRGAQGGGLAMTAATATAIYSVYVATVYLLAMPGGWFGDRVWGPRRTVTVAAAVVMTGHLTLALPGQGPFFAGLTLVALGSGLLKANISTMVGHLYDGYHGCDGRDDPRRDAGFTVFYMGINLGAFAAPLVIGTVGQQVSWHLGFGLAAAGMALGLLQFLLGTRHLSPRSSVVPEPLTAAERDRTVRSALLWAAAVGACYAVVVLSGGFTLNWALVPITVVGLAIPVAVLTRMKRDRQLPAADQARISGYIWFFAAAAVFWMIYDQGGSTMAVFGSTKASGQLFGFGFPSSWYQSVNPLCVMALAPLMAWAWPALARRGREPGTTVKFALGLFLIGVSFFVFVPPMAMAAGPDGARVSPLWLVAVYLVQTVGELCLSPVGLSVTTRMAPAKYGSQMMGVWFLAVTAGDCATGLMSLAGVDLNGTGVVAMEATLACAAGYAVWASRHRVVGLMGEVR
jgi:proton-dependent oligopeptide transporter, POT family